MTDVREQDPDPTLSAQAQELPTPTWRCVGCTASFVWQTRVGDEKNDPGVVHDRAPFIVTVDGVRHDCCTRECARNVWFVKSLEAVTDRIVPQLARAIAQAGRKRRRRI